MSFAWNLTGSNECHGNDKEMFWREQIYWLSSDTRRANLCELSLFYCSCLVYYTVVGRCLSPSACWKWVPVCIYLNPKHIVVPPYGSLLSLIYWHKLNFKLLISWDGLIDYGCETLTGNMVSFVQIEQGKYLKWLDMACNFFLIDSFWSENSVVVLVEATRLETLFKFFIKQTSFKGASKKSIHILCCLCCTKLVAVLSPNNPYTKS